MAFLMTPMVVVLALISFAVYKYIFYPIFVSPLSRIPNAHWSSPISPFWILYHRQQQNDTPTVHAAHKSLGPLVRLAPNEISVNSVDGGIRTIYAGGFEKGNWYSNVFSNYGVQPMFAMEAHGPHSKRKRMVSNIYAKSTLQTSPALTKITQVLINDRLLPRLKADMRSGQPIEFYDVFSAVFMDFVAGYVFGLKNGSDFLRQKNEGAKFFRDYKARQKYTFWPQEMPKFTNSMQHIGLRWLLVPTWVDSANQSIENWIMDMCVQSEAICSAPESETSNPPVEDYPTVYSQVRSALLKEASKTSSGLSASEFVQKNRLHIASEVLDHTLAGFDTSGVTTTWLAWELSRPCNAEWQQKLRTEIATLSGSLDAKTIDGLPVMHAILMETLRMHAAIPGNQPRITPASPVAIGDAVSGIVVSDLPPNVRVQAQAWSLHRNPAVFHEPETWNPSRWLDASEEQKREIGRWFWAFGSGGRMCVGSNLAMLDMKATMTGIWGNFRTDIADDEGMVHNGGYLAEPLGVGPGGKKGIGEGRRFLLLRITQLEGEKRRKNDETLN